jgi:hypothetical protein
LVLVFSFTPSFVDDVAQIDEEAVLFHQAARTRQASELSTIRREVDRRSYIGVILLLLVIQDNQSPDPEL